MARNTKNTTVAPVVETPVVVAAAKPIIAQHGYVEQLVDLAIGEHVAAGGRVDVASVAASTTESPAAIVKLVADRLAPLGLTTARVNRDMRWLLCSRTSPTIGADANGKPTFIPRGHRSTAAAAAREAYATLDKPTAVAKPKRNRKS